MYARPIRQRLKRIGSRGFVHLLVRHGRKTVHGIRALASAVGRGGSCLDQLAMKGTYAALPV